MSRDQGASPSGEEWRAIEGYEGLYEVSSLGRLRSMHASEPRILRGGKTPDGYPVISLYSAGKRFSTQLHQVVCETFNGPKPQADFEVAHLDGCRTNAAACNLRWVTKRENHSHKLAHGTHLFGERHPRAVLNAAQAAEIYRRASTGDSASALSKEFGVSPGTILDIRTMRRWRSIHESAGPKDIAQPSSGDA